tara:strand:- start:9816 stop:10238 length:423 start_codon:yes stop_codon:yes gene_type:complete
MGTEAIGTGLKVNLGNISSLKAIFAPNEVPDTISRLPCAVILPGPTEYLVAYGSDAFDVQMRVLILITKQQQPQAMAKILDYIDPTGSESVRKVVNDDTTLDSSCDEAWVVSSTGAGFTTWNGTPYLSIEFLIQCLGSGS